MSNLILTRKKQESIILYREVYEAGVLENEILCKIVVTSLGTKQVKLAFEAKNNIKIDRKEVFETREQIKRGINYGSGIS